MGKLSRRDAALFEKLDALYARLPRVECQQRCGEACGPMTLTPLEAQRLHVVTRTKPRVVDENRCVYLTPQGRCRAYAVRPMVCRIWGTVKLLSCPHGCVPSTWLDNETLLEFEVLVERLSGGRRLLTTPSGVEPAESFTEMHARTTAMGVPRKSAASQAADAERTRSLRAIFGGRIIAAVSEDP